MSKVIVNNSLTLDGVMQGPGRPDEGPPRRLRARRLGGALLRFGHGRHGGRMNRQGECPAVRATDLRGFRCLLAQPVGGQPLHHSSEQLPEVRCVKHLEGAAPRSQRSKSVAESKAFA